MVCVCEARQKNQVSIDTADYMEKNFLKYIYKQTDMPIRPLLEILVQLSFHFIFI